VALAVGATLAAVAVVAGGAAVGSMLANDPGVTIAAPTDAAVDEDVLAPGPTEAPATPEQAAAPAGPLDPAGDAAEPVAAVAAAVAPSVVRIDTDLGTGSGIIADAEGMIITNAHVVQGVRTVTVQLADGTRTEGVVEGTDERVDVAVVDIDPAGLNLVPATFAPWDSVETGQLAVAIGSPFGLEQTVTSGIVSAVNRVVGDVEMIQTDAPINPGNSGGALADRQGRVIGMNSSIRTDGSVNGNLGVGFAIPSDTMLLVAERIVSGENLTAGFLGVSLVDPTLGQPGALITELVAGGPADSGGLAVGDLVTAFDGVAVHSTGELGAKIRIAEPGSTHEVMVVRDDQELTVTVTLGSLTES
jgi:putative serine protease PepD